MPIWIWALAVVRPGLAIEPNCLPVEIEDKSALRSAAEGDQADESCGLAFSVGFPGTKLA